MLVQVDARQLHELSRQTHGQLVLLAADRQRLGLLVQPAPGGLDRLLVPALALAQPGHVLQDGLDLSHANHPAAQVAVQGLFMPDRLVPEGRQRRFGRAPGGVRLGVAQALPGHGDLGLAFAETLDRQQLVEHAHCAPTISVMRARASARVARSSVRWRRKVLIAPILSMASSVTASPPRLYSPIFTSSSTS